MEQPGVEPARAHARLDLGRVVARAVLEIGAHGAAESRSRDAVLHFDTWRHNVTVEDDRLLDAARECVLAVGVRRTTVTDVARRAGVSRMTLYRRYPDLEAVLAALMTREFGRLIGRPPRARRRASAWSRWS